jgi:hypothetical protein
MLSFEKLQERFPNEVLSLNNRRIYLNDLPVVTRWPDEKEYLIIQDYNGDATDELLLDTLVESLQTEIDMRALGFVKAIELAKARRAEKYGLKKF